MSDTAVMLAPAGALAPASLAGQVDELDRALSFFERMGKAALLPEGVKSPADALMLAAAGQRLGLDLMTSLRAFHIIKGQIQLKADMMRAVVLGAAQRSGVDIRFEESTKARAVLVGVRNGQEIRVEVTIEDAKQAQLTSNPMWAKFPAQMLLAWATRILGRMIFPDLLAGIYTPDEMGGTEITAPYGVRTRDEARLPLPADPAPDVEDAEVEEVRYTATEKGKAFAAHPRLEYLLGDDLETLCWYLSARDKPIAAPTVEAAVAWADGVAEAAWAKHGPAIREALTRRRGLIESAGGPLALLKTSSVGSPMWTKAHGAAERLGLPNEAASWPPRALVGVMLAVAEEKTEAPAPKKGPGAKALEKALEAPGGWEAIVAGFRRAGVEAPRVEGLSDAQQGELAYSIVKWCQASASAEDTTACVQEALSDRP